MTASGSHAHDVPPPVTRESLRAMILDVTQEWIAEGRVVDARAIGDGRCYDFARTVMERLGSDEHGAGFAPDDSTGRLIDCVTEDWWSRIVDDDGIDIGEAEPFTMDIARLRAEGAPLPEGIADEDDDFARILGSMTHDWIVLDGKHYDATCPDGASHFLLMPFFADQISAFMAQRVMATTPQKAFANHDLPL